MKKSNRKDASDSGSDAIEGSSAFSEDDYTEHTPRKGKSKIDPSKRKYSSYENGFEGRCRDCELLRKQCTCHHCRSCGTYMVTLHSRHHCRRCWRPFCPDCSRTQQVNDFKTGEPGRTCDLCAPHKGLMFALGAMQNFSMEVRSKGGKDPDTFLWGAHALYSGIEGTRCCTNPSCSNPFSAAAACTKCKLPTVTASPYVTRSIVTYDMAKGAKESKDALTGTEASVTEFSQRAVADNADIDSIPVLEQHKTLFNNAKPSVARKIMLGAIAAEMANEYHGSPALSLAMSDLPNASQLCVRRVTPKYTEVQATGRVFFYAFPHVYNKGKLTGALSPITVRQEVWSTNNANRIGVLADNNEDALRKGGKELLVSGKIQVGVFNTVMEQENDYKDVINGILQRIENGDDVVLCGHSVGGSIAMMLAIKVLVEHTFSVKDNLLCITYGAPLVVDHTFTDFFIQRQLFQNFHNVVYDSDLVPRIHYLDNFLEKSPTEEEEDDISGANTNDDGSEENPEEANRRGMAGRMGSLEHIDSMLTLSDARNKIILWISLFLPSVSAPISAFNRELIEKKKKRKVSALFNKKKEAVGDDDNAGEPNSIDKKDEDEMRKKISSPRTAGGDMFAELREPFQSNYTPQKYLQEGRREDSLSAIIIDEGKISCSSEEHRLRQGLDPLGVYHVLWRGGGRYECSTAPRLSIGLLSDKTGMRLC
ncbi:class 3 lipase [Angomonas deanei]|uniref:Lipase (Class 3), putative n=1 Tax=Angomonas deanei TaxID=59799 RepID=A0A7G2CI21_9TRYP|nr:class 3 lipase [Angomonas deanei]CAD2219510.1 Lipase (class 3), putative [Angomonas deanei]|eukprot:EPY32097.1 class 3 lipase [Angomonas deanei]